MRLNPHPASSPPPSGSRAEGRSLDVQHADQTRRFLRNAAKFRIDHQARIVYLSPIFDWFGDDFIATHGARPVFLWGTPKERAVMSFIAPHLGDADRVALKSGEYTVRYLGYDWSLNSRASP